MRNKTEYDRFPIAKRGYEPQSVEAHLDEIAVGHDRMLDEAAARIAALEVELEESRKQEEAVHLTILAATKTKEDMLEAARHQAAEFAANGRKEGDRIVTDARMQAFQLVTGAREEAGTIVREARAEAAAVSRVDEDTPIPDQGPSERESALQQRIEEMQHVVAAMELELSRRPAHGDSSSSDSVETAAPGGNEKSSKAATKVDEAPPETEAIEDVAPPAPTPEHIEIVVTDAAPSERAVDISDDDTEIAVDDVAVSVDPTEDLPEATSSPHEDGSITDERKPEAVRRSFYSRRSAKLPRIGAEGGRGAMAAVAGLRANVTTSEAEDDADPEKSAAFEAV
jgi:cell division septum initiation protein DivIVA